MLSTLKPIDSGLRGQPYGHRAASNAIMHAPPAQVFENLDSHARLARHMSRRSWRMGWGRMQLITDEDQGRAVGSRLVLSGRIFGLRLHLEEAVLERTPPYRKLWETVGEPRLLVIGRYRMGFTITPVDSEPRSSSLTVFIEYDLPAGGLFARSLGKLLGHRYARWCTNQMVADAAMTFA